jgi:rare lipoprotein A
MQYSMTKLSSIFALILVVFLTACGGGPAEKPPYAGIKLGKPYSIYGRWYKPHYNAHYDEVGTASWYGPGFHGGKTANGERFDQDGLTGAHRTLPLPSIVRVTNLDNGKSALVRINDRGPFARDRIIDLSKASATKLGVIRTGTAKVRVQFLDKETRDYVQNMQNGTQYAMESLKNVNLEEASEREEERPATASMDEQPVIPVADQIETEEAKVIEPSSNEDAFSAVENNNHPAPASNPVPPTMGYLSASVPASASVQNTPAYFIQLGTFSHEENANRLSATLSSMGNTETVETLNSDKKLFKVLMGPYISQESAKNMLSKLVASGISGARIIQK